MRTRLTIPARRIAFILGFFAVLLAIQSISGKFIQDAAGDDSPELLDTLVTIFNINREQSVPTWYTSSLLLLSALTLGVIAQTKRATGAPYRRHWYGLAAIFLYLSLDEAIALHEYLTDPVGEALNTTGPLYFAWVIVGAIAVIIFGLVFLRFWLHLDPGTRLRFAFAAALYVGGALGVELIGSNIWYLNDGSNLSYSSVGTVEELMEALGVVVFFYGLLAHLAAHVGEIELVLVNGVAPATADAADPIPAALHPHSGAEASQG